MFAVSLSVGGEVLSDIDDPTRSTGEGIRSNVIEKPTKRFLYGPVVRSGRLFHRENSHVVVVSPVPHTDHVSFRPGRDHDEPHSHIKGFHVNLVHVVVFPFFRNLGQGIVETLHLHLLEHVVGEIELELELCDDLVSYGFLRVPLFEGRDGVVIFHRRVLEVDLRVFPLGKRRRFFFGDNTVHFRHEAPIEDRGFLGGGPDLWVVLVFFCAIDARRDHPVDRSLFASEGRQEILSDSFRHVRVLPELDVDGTVFLVRETPGRNATLLEERNKKEAVELHLFFKRRGHGHSDRLEPFVEQVLDVRWGIQGNRNLFRLDNHGQSNRGRGRTIVVLVLLRFFVGFLARRVPGIELSLEFVHALQIKVRNVVVLGGCLGEINGVAAHHKGL
mmetsp:Transcript_12927/g.27347  ORF Transcript_12927/g.27347 Transcript_12927/m.27347 type:complete len:387 (-) Transcript_12927:268-1428(-)